MGNRAIVSFFTAFLLLISQVGTAFALSDINNSDNKTAILYVQEKGIVQGYSDGTFRPNALVNRAELVKILMATTTSSEELNNCPKNLSADATTMYFSDAARDAWYAPFLCVAHEKGFVKGYPDGTFRAGDNITTIEAVKVIVEILGYTVQADTETWYKPYLTKLEALRALPKSLKYITAPVTRGEVAEMIWRIREGKTGEYSTSANTLIRNQLLKDQGKL